MAMLAEPRRRKRYNLCPRGKALYEDENRFGTKMLEKMGWTKGNGLGAKQDGEKDFVRIRFKNDAEGLGFEARDDQWTTHEEGFNGLLKSLNGEDNEANGKESDPEEENRPMGFGFKVDQPEEPSKKKLKENISGMSLEEKSKQSRARVHYKKFTRGKDLSQYSEKDLANIFGKKATDVVDVPEQLEVEQPKEEKLVDDNFAGVQTVATGLSVSDYFKQKMEAMKNRLKKGVQSTPTMNDNSEEQANGHDEKLAEILAENDLEPSKKKKKKKDKERTVEPTVAQDEIGQSAPKLKKKKSKRSSQDDTEPTEVICVEEKLITSEESNPQKRKKKKDKKEETAEDTSEIIELSVEPTLKKKKSNKKEEVADVIEIIEQIVKPAQKKKSNKSKGTQDFVESVEKNEKPATKKKSNKLHETTEDPLESIENPEEPVPKKKKKSKKPELADSEVIIINDDLSETMYENVSKKKGTKCKDGNQTHVGNDLEIADETSTKKKKKSKEPKRPETEEVESKEIPPPASDIQKTSKKKNKLNKTANAVLESSALATPKNFKCST
ncbi:PIN2/TERF1-interacting telomerase inhibitor 1 isoform X2 [Drosophila eugracilis]|uniref:PIN2/TERF1-interacting telomerase inhibitor 1 isoform X2 n=1 Tax=Drosophila eugracilis TaxID=29029 RepID=UPI001BDA8548|nr:PIN2/TERF1-interacting telomerase inhibitor 1 isoform X2 [Drosophila eugracilis]